MPQPPRRTDAVSDLPTLPRRKDALWSVRKKDTEFPRFAQPPTEHSYCLIEPDNLIHPRTKEIIHFSGRSTEHPYGEAVSRNVLRIPALRSWNLSPGKIWKISVNSNTNHRTINQTCI